MLCSAKGNHMDSQQRWCPFSRHKDYTNLYVFPAGGRVFQNTHFLYRADKRGSIEPAERIAQHGLPKRVADYVKENRTEPWIQIRNSSSSHLRKVLSLTDHGAVDS